MRTRALLTKLMPHNRPQTRAGESRTSAATPLADTTENESTATAESLRMVFCWQPILSRAGVMLGAFGCQWLPTVSLPFASFSCMAAAKMRAEFNAQIAELRRELLAHRDACVAHIKTVFETEVATLQRQLVEARAEPSKLQMLEASRSGSDTTRLN